MKKNGVKKINSRPYHPETQGKCERSHRTLKKKLNLLKRTSKGSNWVKDLPKVLNSMNTTAKEVLNYQTPFDIFFGRAKDMSSVKSNVARSSKRCLDRNQRYLTTDLHSMKSMKKF